MIKPIFEVVVHAWERVGAMVRVLDNAKGKVQALERVRAMVRIIADVRAVLVALGGGEGVRARERVGAVAKDPDDAQSAGLPQTNLLGAARTESGPVPAERESYPPPPDSAQRRIPRPAQASPRNSPGPASGQPHNRSPKDASEATNCSRAPQLRQAARGPQPPAGKQKYTARFDRSEQAFFSFGPPSARGVGGGGLGYAGSSDVPGEDSAAQRPRLRHPQIVRGRGERSRWSGFLLCNPRHGRDARTEARPPPPLTRGV